jgi:hypothetical protein
MHCVAGSADRAVKAVIRSTGIDIYISPGGLVKTGHRDVCCLCECVSVSTPSMCPHTNKCTGSLHVCIWSASLPLQKDNDFESLLCFAWRSY